MAEPDTTMPNAPPTPTSSTSPTTNLTSLPTEDPEPQNPSVEFSPQTVPYNESFENSLMETILNPPSTTTPPPQPTPDSNSNANMIPASQLPIPLDSPLRTHPSPIPGLYVTNPNGYHTGGPSPSANTITSFAEEFIHRHGIEDAGQLERVVEAVMKEKMEEVSARMEERRTAVERNKDVDEELEKLRLSRDAEVRVWERMRGKR